MSSAKRALQACGLLVLGLALLWNAGLSPGPGCPYSTWFGACVDYAQPAAAPSAVAGLLLLALALGVLWSALDTLQRAFLVASVLGGVLVFAAWTRGILTTCTFGGPEGPTACSSAFWPAQVWGFVVGGVLLGAGLVGMLGLAWLKHR